MLAARIVDSLSHTETHSDITHVTCVNGRYRVLQRPAMRPCALSSRGAAAYVPACPHRGQEAQRAAALVEAARSLALESGVASVTLTDVASRAGVHYSAVRRYFTSHKEVLLNLAAEGWARFSDTVCASLGQPGDMSPPGSPRHWPKGWRPTHCSATCSPTCMCTSKTRSNSNGFSNSRKSVMPR